MQTASAAARCPKCHDLSYLLLQEGDFTVAQVCDCSRECRRCQGSGYVYVRREETFSKKVGPKSYEVLDLCSCRLLLARVETMAHAGIPGMFAQASFEAYQPANQKESEARQIASAFAQGFVRNKAGKGFVLAGPVGTGKTHLICAALKHLILERGVRARYVEISLLYADIRRGFSEEKAGGEIIAPLSEYEVLAIDELGKGRGSPFELETLDELIARRYNAGRTTLFATNYSLQYDRTPVKPAAASWRTEDMKKVARDSELLRDHVGERIYSRLCQMCDFVELPQGSPDRRRSRQELDGEGPRGRVIRSNR